MIQLKRISTKTHEDDAFLYGEEHWEDGSFITFWMQAKGRTYGKSMSYQEVSYERDESVGPPYWNEHWVPSTYDQKVKNFHIVEKILSLYHSKEKVQELMDLYHPYPKREEEEDESRI